MSGGVLFLAVSVTRNFELYRAEEELRRSHR